MGLLMLRFNVLIVPWGQISVQIDFYSVVTEYRIQEWKHVFQKRTGLSEVCMYTVIFAFYLKI